MIGALRSVRRRFLPAHVRADIRDTEHGLDGEGPYGEARFREIFATRERVTSRPGRTEPISINPVGFVILCSAL